MAPNNRKKVLTSTEFKATLRKSRTEVITPRITNLSQKARDALKRTNAAIKANQTRKWKKKVAITEAKKKLATPVTHHRSYSD